MPTAKITYVKVNGLASYSAPRSLVTYTDLRLETFLDADTKNRYFRLDGFAFDDSASVITNKSLQDSILGFTDSAYAAVTKNASDTLSFSDEYSITTDFRRSQTDSALVADSLNVQLRSLASSVLNTTAMNVATLNN